MLGLLLLHKMPDESLYENKQRRVWFIIAFGIHLSVVNGVLVTSIDVFNRCNIQRTLHTLPKILSHSFMQKVSVTINLSEGLLFCVFLIFAFSVFS